MRRPRFVPEGSFEKKISSALGAKFCELVGQWYEGTAHLSTVTQMEQHPAFQAIMALRSPETERELIVLILEELQDGRGHWFHALRILTGADPVDSKDRGRLKKMQEAWIRWGMENGYLVD